MGVNVKLGTNEQVLNDYPSNYFDSIVTDPPYGIKFMGKKWDYDLPSVNQFEEFLRVIKPGAHILVACGTRTNHRMAVNIEDAGFIIKDTVAWVYGEGFPKNHNLGRATKSPEYEGWGTALKPSMELWTLAQKPISEKNIAENVLKWGTGGINVDGCRVGTDEDTSRTNVDTAIWSNGGMSNDKGGGNSQGRFPANLIHDGSNEVVGLFPETGKSTGGKTEGVGSKKNPSTYQFGNKLGANSGGLGDSGSAARFFYCAKASKQERGASNNHPTVKPLKLIQYLTRLITPPGGHVLDPFAGSGTTGVSCENERFECTLIDSDPDNIQIIKQRVSENGSKLL